MTSIVCLLTTTEQQGVCVGVWVDVCVCVCVGCVVHCTCSYLLAAITLVQCRALSEIFEIDLSNDTAHGPRPNYYDPRQHFGFKDIV